MWVIHIKEAQNLYPMAFFLFIKKTNTTYYEVLKLLKADPNKMFLGGSES